MTLWTDLCIFKENFNNKNWEDAVNKKSEEVLKLLMHQSLHKKKALSRIENSDTVELLIAAISRSGKSYTTAGIIDGYKNLNDRRCDYLIITTAKNETMKQWYEVFDYANFDGYKIHDLNANTIDAIEQYVNEEDNDNIIIVSADYLKNTTGKKHRDNKIKKINWLKKLRVNIIFLDEAHKGGMHSSSSKDNELVWKYNRRHPICSKNIHYRDIWKTAGYI